MKYIKTIIFESIFFVSLTLILTILYYFNIINSNLNNIFKIIIFIITFLLSGIYIGKRSNKKYYLEGLKISFINIILFILISLLLKNNFNIKQFIYYLLIIIITTFGSIISINLKKYKK